MKLVLLVVFTSLVAADSGAENDEAKTEISTREAFTGKCGTRPYDSQKKPKCLLESLHTDFSRDATDGRQSKIVGGRDADRGQYPWQGHVNAIVTRTDGRRLWSPFCGAVIVGEYWLLSAAHCFVDEEGDTIHKDTIGITVDDIVRSRKETEEQRFTVAKIVVHQSYESKTVDYDVALVKIRPSKNTRGIIFNDYVQPACLPDTKTPFIDGTMCMISGFGLNGTYHIPDKLQGADVPLKSQAQCRLSYIFSDQSITDRMFCAGYFEGGVDSCQNDSGGPLVCKTGGTYTVYGVTSWGEGCALKNSLGVYARVSSVLDWIHSTIEKYSKNDAEGHIPSKP